MHIISFKILITGKISESTVLKTLYEELGEKITRGIGDLNLDESSLT